MVAFPVTAGVTVAPNTTPDFGGRALDLRPGASLSFTSGTLTIRELEGRSGGVDSRLGADPGR